MTYSIVSARDESQELIVATLRRFLIEEILPLERELEQDDYYLLPADRARSGTADSRGGFLADGCLRQLVRRGKERTLTGFKVRGPRVDGRPTPLASPASHA